MAVLLRNTVLYWAIDEKDKKMENISFWVYISLVLFPDLFRSLHQRVGLHFISAKKEIQSQTLLNKVPHLYESYYYTFKRKGVILTSGACVDPRLIG